MDRRKLTPWAKRRCRLLLVTSIIFLLLVGFAVWRLQVRRAYMEQVVALREAGIPTTLAEQEIWLEQWSQLPICDELVAPHESYVYQKAETVQELPRFRRIRKIDDIGPELLSVPYPTRELDAMRDLVDRNGEALGQLRTARLSQPQFCHGGASSNVYVVELICAAICLRAQEGHGGDAAEHVLDGVRYIRATSPGQRRDPVGRWFTGWDPIIFGAVASASLRTTFPDSALQAIQANLETTDWRASQRYEIERQLSSRVVKRERVENHSVVDTFKIVSGKSDREVIRGCIRAMTRLAVLESASQRQYERRYETGTGFEVRARLAWLAMEVLRHHARTGSFPSRLSILSLPESRTSDYLGEGEFGYRVDGNQFTIYSVGPDHKDDGGDPSKDIPLRMGVPG